MQIHRLLPQNSKRRAIARKIARRLNLISPRQDNYNVWAHHTQETYSVNDEQFTRINTWKDRPLISIVVPLYKTKNRYLEPLVASVLAQSYTNWELVLVDEAVAPAGSSRDRLVASDDRIRHVVIKKNKGISMSTNAGIKAANGEFIALMDHDDLLTAGALFAVVELLHEDPKLDLIYSDEDKVTDDGETLQTPHFKPKWSPDLLRNVNYITHFTVVRKSIAQKAGLLDSARDGAQDYDFLLRVADVTQRIAHVPTISYHWRLADTSTAADFSIKPQVAKAGRAALQDHLNRNHMKATATILDGRPGFYRVQYDAPPATQCAVVVYIKDSYTKRTAEQVLAHYAALCEQFHYKLISNRSLPAKEGSSVVTHVPASDFAAFVTTVTPKLKANYVAMISDTVVPCDAESLKELFAVARQKHVFAVTPQVLSDAAGHVVDMGLVWSEGLLEPLFKGCPAVGNTLFGDIEWVRNVDALSGRIFAADIKTFKTLTSGNSAKGSFGVDPQAFVHDNAEDTYNVAWTFSKFYRIRPRLNSPAAGQRHGFYNGQLSMGTSPCLISGDTNVDHE